MSTDLNTVEDDDEPGARSPALPLLLREIDNLQAAIRRHFPEIPETVTVVVPRGRRSMLAYSQPTAGGSRGETVDEIGISAEHLGGRVESVATSVLHEAVHARARALGIQDTSRGGRWHNRRFGERAFDMGLKVAQHSRIGCTTPGLMDETFIQYTAELRSLEHALVLVRQDRAQLSQPGPGDTGSGKTSEVTSGKLVSAICGCVTESKLPRRIRTSAGSWEEASIWCRICSSFFKTTETEVSRAC
jgi:hypothetical protein